MALLSSHRVSYNDDFLYQCISFDRTEIATQDQDMIKIWVFVHLAVYGKRFEEMHLQFCSNRL